VPAERHDQARADQFDLANQVRLALLDFTGLRVAVVGWAQLCTTPPAVTKLWVSSTSMQKKVVSVRG